MPTVDIVVDVTLERTARLMQLEGIFDMAPCDTISEHWEIDVKYPDVWNVGLIVGPSGAGKTTILHNLVQNVFDPMEQTWSLTQSILDGFPSDMGIKEIVALLSSVGFSSPPSWRKPYRILSNGEQFRVNVARCMAEHMKYGMLGIDEFTSVVDRNVAKIASVAISKAVRKRDAQIVFASCHYDICDWLEPDWIIEPHKNRMTRGRHRRPDIEIKLRREHWTRWEMFCKHHYLNAKIHKAAHCYVGYVDGVPCVFSAWLYFPHPDKKKRMKEHRTVVLPDYQGVGIGNAVSDFLASAYKKTGKIAISITAHPAMIRSRIKSAKWALTQKPSLHTKNTERGQNKIDKHFAQSVSTKRKVASFRYVGGEATTANVSKLGLEPRRAKA